MQQGGEVVGFTPIKNYQFWFCQKMIKWKKGIFAGIRGEQGGKGERWIVMHFGVCKAYLFLKPHFYFGINIGFVIAEEEFGKHILVRGINQIFQSKFGRFCWFVSIFLFQFEEMTCCWLWGYAADMWLSNNAQNMAILWILSLGF